MARRQLWLNEGSAKDQKLRRLVLETATERDGRWAFEWTPTKIGIVSWSRGAGSKAAPSASPG